MARDSTTGPSNVLIPFMAADYPFKVEEWTKGDHILRLLAGCDNLFVARAAFREAVARYPTSILTLRQGARVPSFIEQGTLKLKVEQCARCRLEALRCSLPAWGFRSGGVDAEGPSRAERHRPL
jgi:hypothetical protein